MTDKTPIFGGEIIDAVPDSTPVKGRNPRTVELALRDNKIPIDAMGYPIGQDTSRVGRAIKRPPGITPSEWLTAIEVAVEHFRMTQGMVYPKLESMIALSDMSERKWEIIYSPDNLANWESALALKGILKKGRGLTHDQMRALRYLTDYTEKGTLEARLKRLQVPWDTFQNWMRDPKFSQQFKALSEEILDSSEPIVTMELARGAMAGKLEYIKYLHQLTGKFDGAVTNADVKSFIQGLVEILQDEIQDPEALKSIGIRLQKLKSLTLGSGN